MSSSYINSEYDHSDEGLVLLENQPSGGEQLGLDPLTLATTGTTLIKPVSSLISGIGSLFGNKRKKKRRKRDAIRNGLYSAGVSRTKFQDYHSDHWGAGKPLVDLIQRHGQPAVDYINERGGHKINDRIGRSLASGFSSWKRQKEEAERKNQEQQLQMQILQQQARGASTGSTMMKYALPAAGGLALLATAAVLINRKKS